MLFADSRYLKNKKAHLMEFGEASFWPHGAHTKSLTNDILAVVRILLN